MQEWSDHDRALAGSLCEEFLADWAPGVRPLELVDRLVKQRWPNVGAEARRQLCDILVVLFQPLMFRNPVMTDDLRERCVALVAAWKRQTSRDAAPDRRFDGSVNSSQCPGAGGTRDS